MKIRLHRWLGVAIAWLGITSASAYDFQVDGIYYDINADEATVTVTNETGDSSGRSYSGEVIIPQSVAYNKKTYSVTSIGVEAFFGCYGLTSMTIPESVTTIGKSAFYYCFNLTSVTIPNSVKTIGDGAFSSCDGLTEVTIPNSVTSIGSEAFSYCIGLTEVTISESVTSIGISAFSGCDDLQSIVVAEGNTSYSSSEGVLFNKDKTALIQYPGGKSGAYTIPNSVTTIGESAFYYSSGLTEVMIPHSVTSIGSGAFAYCLGLLSIVVTEGNASYSSSEGVLFNKDKTALIQCPGGKSGAYMIPSSVTTIGVEAFFGCSGLTSVTIPNSVTTIGSKAFSYCIGLTSVTIPNSVTVIESETFSSCFGLTEMSIPNSVKTIGEGAFSSCTGLTSVAIGNSVSTIGDYAFAYCTELTEVTIGKSVTSIGNYTFVLCTSLETIKSYATTPPAIEANTFSSYNATLYVPVDCGSVYREAEHWANFTNIVESIDSRVEALQDENICVYTVDNTLHVENGGKVYQVYTLAGQLVYTGNNSIIPLDNPGIYIVRTGKRSQKVIVR